MTCVSGPCPTSDELKYTMTRIAIDGADTYIVEHGCATNIKVGIYFLYNFVLGFIPNISIFVKNIIIFV